MTHMPERNRMNDLQPLVARGFIRKPASQALKRVVRLAQISILSLIPFSAAQADETWSNTNASGSWSDPTNWSNGAVPIFSDSVSIIGTASSPVVFTNGGGGAGTTYNAFSIVVDGYELNPTNASHFTLGGGIQIGGARDSQFTIADSASSIAAASFTLAGNAGTNNVAEITGTFNVGVDTVTIGNAVDHSDLFQINAGTTFTAGLVQIGNTGDLDFQSVGVTTFSTTISSLTTGGIVSLTNDSNVSFTGDGSGFKGGFVLSDAVGNTEVKIANASYLTHTTGFTFLNQGLVEIDVTGATTSSSTINLGGNGGTVAVGTGDVFTFAGSLVGADNKTLISSGLGKMVLTGDSSGFAGNIFSNGFFFGEGNIEVASGAILGDQNDATVTVGTGTFTIDAGGVVSVDNAAAIGGILQVNGVLNASGMGGVEVIDATGLLAGKGTINLATGAALIVGNSTDGGTIAAGNFVPLNATSVSASDIGNLTINGDLQLLSDATMIVKIAGTTHGDNATLVPGVDYDHFTVSGNTQLSGTLIVQAGAGVVQGGDKFDIITSTDGFAGDFTAVNILNNALSYSTSIVNTGTVYEVDFTATQNSFTSFATTPNQTAVAGALDQQVTTFGNTPLIVALDSIPGGELPGAFNQLMPLKFGTFASSTAFNNTSFSIQQFDSYLANHRGSDGSFISSNGGVDYSGLAINDPNVDTGLQSVRSRLLAWSPAPSTGLISDSGNLVLGGMDMKDIASQSGPTNLWNVFITGNVVLAQDFSNANAGLPYASSTTGAVQVGADYKITPHWLVGATFAYGHTNATLDTIGSNANVNTYSPGIYTSYSNNGWYANALASYGFADYSQNRAVSIGALSGTAHSSPGGGQVVANLDGGYDFHKGNWTFGPTSGLQYVHLNVDGYSETGLPSADLTVNENESNSLRSRLGGQVSYAVKSGSTIFTPHLSASWQHEFLDQSRGITSQFNGTGAGSFVVNTANPSRESALADVGLDAQVNNALTVFTDYSVQAGQSNYFGQSVQAGVKIGF